MQLNGDTKSRKLGLSSAVSVTVADMSPLHRARLEYFPRLPPVGIVGVRYIVWKQYIVCVDTQGRLWMERGRRN